METAQTADYALLALLELEREDGQTVSQLATALDLNRTVAQRIITTLHQRAAVLKDVDGRYWLGPLLLSLVREIPDELSIISAPYVRDLADRVAETVVVAVADGEEAVIVARESGSRSPLRVEYELGFRQSIGRGASSLAILAFADPALAAQVLTDEEMPQLEEVRRRGYSRTEGQIRADMLGLGAPIHAKDRVVGSLAIVLPSARGARERDLIPELLRTAAEIATAYDASVSKEGQDAS